MPKDTALEFTEFWSDLLESGTLQEMLSETASQAKGSDQLAVFESSMDSSVAQRISLEVLAAHVLATRQGIGWDEALDKLSRQLDVAISLFAPELSQVRHRLGELLADQHFTELLSETSALSVVERVAQAGGIYGVWHLPDWPVKAFLSLAVPEKPVLFLNWGSSALIPRFLLRQLQSGASHIEFLALDRDPTIVENLRLILSLVLADLDQVRDSVRLYETSRRTDVPRVVNSLDPSPAFEPDIDPIALSEILDSELGTRTFGSAIVNAQGPTFQSPRYYAELAQALPALLARSLLADGRAMIMGMPSILDSTMWSKFRETARQYLHLEAVVNFDCPPSWIPEGFDAALPALVILRQPQQVFARQVTAFARSQCDERTLTPDDLLNRVLAYFDGADQSQDVVFERPTSELEDRWDPKFYCPARLKLQDNLVNNAQAAWLGGITELIARQRPLTAILDPYVETQLDVHPSNNVEGAIAPPKVGDTVWLHLETDDPLYAGLACVKRRSGHILGSLPPDLSDNIVAALNELGNRHKATVTQITGSTPERPRPEITVRFPPPQYARSGEAVSVVRPRDIENNRLIGQGELSWLRRDRADQVIRLQAGDILLFLRGFGKACVVPREFAGAVCHQDLAIIRPNPDVDPFYLLAFILGAPFQEQLQYVARGGAMPVIDTGYLGELLVIVPPLPTQRRIALAFAESQGELGPGLREGLERWLGLIQGTEILEERWLPSVSLSALFSDWDQVHTYDDWLRLKGKHVRELRNLVAHSVSAFAEESVNAAMLALGNLHETIERSRLDPARQTDKPQIEWLLSEFRSRVWRIEDAFLRDRLASLAAFLGELLEVERAVLWQPTVQIQEAVRTVEAISVELGPFAPIHPNPYITGGAVDTPEMFFGRQDVLDFLRANLIGAHQSNVIILQGNRRTGKSSILKQVVNRDLFEPHIPIYIDCQGLGKLSDHLFFYKIARVIWRTLSRRDDVASPGRIRRADISEKDPFYDFQEFLDDLADVTSSRRIILLIDEFEVINTAIEKGELDPIVLENLRHLFQHRHDLAVVLTGSYRLRRHSQEYWSILFGLGLTHRVGFLDEQDARRLITQPLQHVVSYSEDAVNRIIALTACQPFFVQMLCHDIVNVLNRRETTYVTQAEVEEAAQETLVSADGHLSFMFKSAESNARQAVLVFMASSLSQPDTLSLYEIHEFAERYRLPLSIAELERELREMAERDIVRIQDMVGQRRYGFKIDLVRQWIRRNYDLQSAIALAQAAPYIREE